MNNELNEAAVALYKMELVPLMDDPTYENLLDFLEQRINGLINNDFPRLIQILYRMDIPENELRMLLKKNEENAANVIAVMMIRRELKKIETRRMFKQTDDIPDEEKW